jgi:hypothetical protein
MINKWLRRLLIVIPSEIYNSLSAILAGLPRSGPPTRRLMQLRHYLLWRVHIPTGPDDMLLIIRCFRWRHFNPLHIFLILHHHLLLALNCLEGVVRAT